MQIQLFTIPVDDSGGALDEMNRFRNRYGQNLRESWQRAESKLVRKCELTCAKLEGSKDALQVSLSVILLVHFEL